jgi:hypothetical protein
MRNKVGPGASQEEPKVDNHEREERSSHNQGKWKRFLRWLTVNRLIILLVIKFLKLMSTVVKALRFQDDD